VTVVKARAIAAVLLPLALTATACGLRPGSAQTEAVEAEVRVAEAPPVFGWMDVSLPGGAPAALLPDDSGAWACYSGGVVLRCDLADGEWRSYSLGPVASNVVSAVEADGALYILSDSALVCFREGAEAVVSPLPEGFTPASAGCTGSEVALLGSAGEIAVGVQGGFEVRLPESALTPCSGLFRSGPDWLFAADDTLMVRYDPTVDLWQIEALPSAGVLCATDAGILLGSGDRVVRRTAPGTWEDLCTGRLFETGMVLSSSGIARASDPEAVLAPPPAVEPGILAEGSGQVPLWAADDFGVLAWSRLGAIETRLPGYDLQRIECSLAGQGGTPAAGGTASVTPVLSAASGAFRIYESVSSRPDPFTEFPASRRDLRRPLDEIAIEELRLVGITLDPAGGDQAMVEDVNAVPYILYVGTELANNTRVAEITNNEVIVVQEVTVDYGPDRGGEASIPTIYSMRLHEEGGL
jgi:hypothetical protein